MSRITEKTLIPISLVIAIGSAVVWLTVFGQETKANTSANARQDQEIKELRGDSKEIRAEVVETQKRMIESLTRIETKLNIKGK